MLIVIYKKTCFCVVEVAFEEREREQLHALKMQQINKQERGGTGRGVIKFR